MNLKIDPLSGSSVNKAILKLQEYADSLPKRTTDLVKRLTEFGYNACIRNVLSLDIYDSGELINSIRTEIKNNGFTGMIVVDCDYAIFVEFGTGIVGKNNAYIGKAMAELGYSYGGGSAYVVTADGRIGWYYPTDDGDYRFTEGMPSRPFMYRTGIEISNMILSLAKGAFKE